MLWAGQSQGRYLKKPKHLRQQTNAIGKGMSDKERIKKAIDFAVQYGSIDGAHHKTWVIDQMVRALTSCPMIEGEAKDYYGTLFTYKEQGESDEYKKLVADAKAGEDGPETYSWDEGICP